MKIDIDNHTIVIEGITPINPLLLNAILYGVVSLTSTDIKKYTIFKSKLKITTYAYLDNDIKLNLNTNINKILDKYKHLINHK